MRFRVDHVLPLAALTLLAACGGGEGARVGTASQGPSTSYGPAADYPVVLGAPFTVDGVAYTPEDKMNYDAVGFASFGSEGGANITAGHRTLALPSYVEVTALDTGKTILVRVERRGPMSGKDLVELSPGAAAQLGITGQYHSPIRVRRVNPIEQERALLRAGQPAPARMDTPKSLLTVLQRKLDLQEGIVRPAPVATPSPAPAPLPAPVPAPAPKPDKGKKPKPVPAPKSAPGPAPAPKPAPAPVTTPSAVHGKFVVQVGAFSNEANAKAAAAKVGGSVSSAGKLWRVRMGPYPAEAQAKAALAKARSAGYSDARIQHAD